MTFTFQGAEGLGSLATLALMDWGHDIFSAKRRALH